jgi:polyvinyl alcohol dehydrogenase (cytochrome)
MNMKYRILISWMIYLSVGMAAAPVYAQEDAAYLFETHCAICHKASNNGAALGPELEVLRQMTPEHILEVMDTGVMQSQARERTRTQRYILAEYLSGKAFGSVPDDPIPQSAFCSGITAEFRNTPSGPAWNGWGQSITNARFQPAESAGLSAEDVPRLRLKWAFGYPGATTGGTQPVVVGGRLYVGNAVGDVFSLDAETGCVQWMIQVDGGVRSAISIGKPSDDGKLMAFFGDQAANAYGVDAESGKVLWKLKIDNHPRAVVTGAPTLHGGRLYVPVSSREESQVRNPGYPCCQFRGSMVALDASNGNMLWKTYTIDDEAQPLGINAMGTQLWGPSGVPIWNAPSIDIKRNLLYAGTGNNYSIPATDASDAIVAFDLDSGEIRWVRQVAENDVWSSACRAFGQDPYLCPDTDAPDTDFGNSPVLVELSGQDILIAGNKLGLVYAFDPDNEGEIIWQESTGKGATSGGIMWGTAVDGEKVYAANNYFNTSEPESTGGISAIDVVSGRTIWTVPPLSCAGRERCKPSHAAAVTVIPGVVFSGTMDGRLRALSTRDGKTLWEYDTAKDFETVNGVKANGGSMSNAGATVVGGIVYINSGYAHHGAIIPGNVLLAFSVD